VGAALAALSVKLDARDVEPGAVALVKRMEAEQNAFALWGLGGALAVLSEKLDARDVKRGAAALAHAIKNANGLDLERLTVAWRDLEHVAYADLDLQKRIQAYVDLLRLPLVVEDPRKALLDGLEKLTGEEFEGDLWRFVDLATESDKGKALRLDLAGP
jgi:hypothetical protein